MCSVFCVPFLFREKPSEEANILSDWLNKMTSEGRCDEKVASSECYVQLPRRDVEQMTEMLQLFLMTAAQLAQLKSTDNQVSFKLHSILRLINT